MKILYILRDMNIESSVSNVMFNVILNLNIQSEIICIGKTEQKNYKKLLNRKQIRYTEFSSLKEALLNLDSIIKIATKYDILYLSTYNPLVIGDLIKRIYPHIKIVSGCYSSEIDEASLWDLKGDNKIANAVRLREKSNYYQKHDCVVAVSKYVQDYLIEIGCANSTVIHNGIYYDKLKTINDNIKTKPKTNTIHFCQAGVVFKLKNQLYSVHLIKYLKDKGLDVKLHIAGNLNKNKEYTNNIKEFIKENKLEDNIIMHGFLSHNELYKIYNLSDIYIMPSLVEGLPMALLEAFYFELPAIVSQYGGMKEVMTNSNGIIINVDNQDDYHRVYDYCKDKQYIEDGKNAKKIALKKHTAKLMADKNFQVYERLLDINNIFNILDRKKVYLFPKNDKMEKFEKNLLNHRICIHGYAEIIHNNLTYDYLVIDKKADTKTIQSLIENDKVIYL